MTDRESVERPWASPMLASLLEKMANQPGALDSYVIASGASMAITEIRALRAALDAAEARAEKAEAEVKRLQTRMKQANALVKRILADQHWRTADDALWGDLCAFSLAALQEIDR